MLLEFVSTYERLRAERRDVQAKHDAFDEFVYHAIDGTKREGRFRPAKLPPADRLPAARLLFDKRDKPPPAQRELAMVVMQQRWLHALAAAEERDARASPGTLPHRDAARFIAASQPEAGAWLDIFPDGTAATRIESAPFEVALERRGGLRIALAAEAFDALEARGHVSKETGDASLITVRQGDRLANGGEYNRRHHAVVYAVYKMVAAVAIGSVVLGDKEKPALTADLNESHTVDLASLGAAEDGGDVLHEIKVPSPLSSAKKGGFKTGKGNRASGGTPASVGHLLGHGNTQEEYRALVLGVPGKGRPGGEALDHSTGRGWVAPRKGQYHAAQRRKTQIVAWVVEAGFGGIDGYSKAHIRYLGRKVGDHGATDRTVYGRHRGSPRSYATHHTQQIVKAAVVGDAKAIVRKVAHLKTSAFSAASARAAGTADGWGA